MQHRYDIFMEEKRWKERKRLLCHQCNSIIPRISLFNGNIIHPEKGDIRKRASAQK